MHTRLMSQQLSRRYYWLWQWKPAGPGAAPTGETDWGEERWARLLAEAARAQARLSRRKGDGRGTRLATGLGRKCRQARMTIETLKEADEAWVGGLGCRHQH